MVRLFGKRRAADRRAFERSDLWHRLEAFEFDREPVARSFESRLAETCNWDAETTEGAIREYLRFMYLAVTAGHPVTPSIAVDLVWHQHLAYSRSYWERFCPEVLGRALHHEPTGGGPEAKARYREQYEATLASYARIFGEDPPPRYWPRPETRFAKRAEPRLYAPRRHAIVSFSVLLTTAIGVIGGLFVVLGGFDIIGFPGVMMVFGALGLVSAWLSVLLQAFGLRPTRGGSSSVGIESSGGNGDGDGGGCGGD